MSTVQEREIQYLSVLHLQYHQGFHDKVLVLLQKCNNIHKKKRREERDNSTEFHLCIFPVTIHYTKKVLSFSNLKKVWDESVSIPQKIEKRQNPSPKVGRAEPPFGNFSSSRFLFAAISPAVNAGNGEEKGRKGDREREKALLHLPSRLRGPNVAVQGPNLAVQGPNLAVQGPNLAPITQLTVQKRNFVIYQSKYRVCVYILYIVSGNYEQGLIWPGDSEIKKAF